ncbi:MAG: permease [Candidatus Dojkabacteria bacterium]
MKIQNSTLNKLFIALLILTLFVFITVRPDTYLTSPAGADTLRTLNDFLTTFRSILIQSFPFLFIGVAISVVVGLFFKEEWIIKILPKNRFLSHMLISLFGVFMPVCECGNIPVARRLIMKGFTVSQSVTFLLAAPIINPITIWTTYEAFKDIYPDPVIIVSRVLGGFMIANFIGILLSYKTDQFGMLTDKFYKEVCDHKDEIIKNKFTQGLDIFQREFITVASALVFGSLIASVTSIYFRDIVLSIGQSPTLSIAAMILFALVVSVCSSVDSFLVITYTSSFTVGSIISYLLFGPMIDIKVLAMLKSTFKTKTLITIALLVTLLSAIAGLFINYIL